MSKGYRPAEVEVESNHYARWERAGYFAPSGRGEPYCIVIPPPNVTGTLHMGHAFQHTIMDALIRWHRMLGRNVLWQPGTDHAGIATQMVVERLLNAEGTSRRELGREKFVERVWQWKERSGGTISRQMRRLGASVDWSRDRFTMDEGLSRAVVEVFVRLYDEGLIYRGKRLVNWDPVLHTALSDLEVLSSEEKGKLWRFRYPLAEGNGYLVVATTRPETMLGDTAVAVHPDDERYRHLIGKAVRLPIAERTIPIIADEYVDPEFGTGCVKITPAHDFNDYEVGLRHGLPMINVFDENAALNDNTPEAYRGLDRFVAREKIVAEMQALGLLDGIDDHVSMIPRGDRSGAVVEPYLTDQWYVRTKPLAEAAIAAVEDGRVRFVPENWSKTYFEWMRNIQDWCISRQLWWGHRIPAWYDDQGRIYVGRDEADARAKNNLPPDLPLRQDEDVLDTWFSSALWPFSTLGWPDKTEALKTWYPTNVLVTGFDIIFFWVARMIMMGLKFAGDVPFREVYIHGLVRDAEGQKMSKSKGNILDPLDVVDGIDLEGLVAKRTEGLMQTHLKSKIEATTRKEFPNGIPAFGADALRLTFASLATTGRDIRFDLGRVDGYHRFCNKLWNATSYVLSHLARGVPAGERKPTVADRWIRSRLARAVRAAHDAVAAYRFDLMTQALYDFAWHELCDWYLELTKPVLQASDADPREVASTRATLAETLDALLKLLHPLAPFVTEDLWLKLAAATGAKGETIMLTPLPRPEDYAVDAEAEAEMEWLQSFVVGIRQIRGEMNISPSQRLVVKLAGANATDRDRVARHRAYLERLAVLAEISEVESASAVRGAATALVGDMQLLVPLAGLVDIGAERERLGKQLERASADLEKGRRKLDNAAFVANAPADVVAKERERVAELEQRIERLRGQLERLDEIA
ncbi:MAG: valine--tRNA ligase [Gammaproteobacteria bacterium]|nr:valine--tRNA ligase [Gammaproteobacteria bacterium]